MKRLTCSKRKGIAGEGGELKFYINFMEIWKAGMSTSGPCKTKKHIGSGRRICP